MVLIFATEARFVKDKEGSIFYENSSFSASMWEKYLNAFENIIVVARVKTDETFIGKKEFRANSEKIRFCELPHFIGPSEFLKKRSEIKKRIDSIVRNKNQAYIARVPGAIGTLFAKQLWRKKIPFGLEVVGDPWDVFSPGSVNHPLSFFFRIQGYLSLKKTVKRASAVLYVTRFTLQKRYPAKASAFRTFASNVEIRKEILQTKPKVWTEKTSYSITSVGSLAQLYKSPDVLINSIKHLEHTVSCKLVWYGDGAFRKEMIKLSEKMGLSQKVHFPGSLERAALLEEIKNSDLFVLASKTEGLPRALVEAMALGLPCVGTNVGGIPELLDDYALVPPGDYKALAKRINYFLSDKEMYNLHAERNLKEAKKYLEEKLEKRRNEFFNELKILY